MAQSDIEAYCVDENLEHTREIVSPSGNYKVISKTYRTATPERPSWGVTKNFIYRVHTEELITAISRNWGFTHTFFNRTNAEDEVEEWLCSGYTYTSQCFVNLNTGAIYHNRDADDTVGTRYPQFCWKSVSPNSTGTLLAVEGCVWGAPYELKFYDFSDPSAGWPELKLRDYDSHFGLELYDETAHHWIDAHTHEFVHRLLWCDLYDKPVDHLEGEAEWNAFEASPGYENETTKEMYRLHLRREGNEMVYASLQSTPIYDTFCAHADAYYAKRSQFLNNFLAMPRYVTLKAAFPEAQTFFFYHNGCHEDLDAIGDTFHFGASVVRGGVRHELRLFATHVELNMADIHHEFPNVEACIAFMKGV